jgi:hypothetical protein
MKQLQLRNMVLDFVEENRNELLADYQLLYGLLLLVLFYLNGMPREDFLTKLGEFTKKAKEKYYV